MRSSPRYLPIPILMAVLGLVLASCTFPSGGGARVPTTIASEPDAGPELVEVPVGDLTVVMQPGHSTPEEVDAVLEEMPGYVVGSGIHLATYFGASRIDIYRFTSIDEFPGPGPDGPMNCIGEVGFGQGAMSSSCGGADDGDLEYGMGGWGWSESDHGDYSVSVEVGTEVETVVVETTTGYTIVIVPAGGIAYAEWRRHDPTRVTVFHRDGSTESELIW